MWRVNRKNFSGGDSTGATDVDQAGGFADVGIDAPAAALQSIVKPIEQSNGVTRASSARDVNASAGASRGDTSATSLDAAPAILHGGTSATSLDASAAILHGRTSAKSLDASAAIGHGGSGGAGVGPNGATPAQVRQAVNGTALPTTGAGVMVGVMSDSFNYLGGAAQDEADGKLPPAADVLVLQDLPNPSSSPGSDEGRAMMQIVHDVARGAKLAFYTAGLDPRNMAMDDQDFANGILALANAGCRVICDDYTNFDEPFFQTGVVANAIQQVEQQGVIYVTCAGNQAARAYQSSWSNIASTTYGGQTLTNTLNFGTATNPNPVQTITMGGDANSDSNALILQWNVPYGSTSTTSNLALVLFQDGTYVGTFDNTNCYQPEPGNPLVIKFLDPGHTYQVAIEFEGPGPIPSSLFVKDEVYNDGNPLTVTFNGANAGTVFGHHMSPYAITVGAVDSANTVGNGGSPTSEFFSSWGAGTQLWFNYNGTSVTNAPQLLSPVAISGVDDIDTSVSSLAPFFGTSAATPTVAAVIANMLQINPALTFAQIYNALQTTALPLVPPTSPGPASSMRSPPSTRRCH
jgi:hypothetical protein